MLQGLGIRSTLITDGKTPINLYQAGNGIMQPMIQQHWYVSYIVIIFSVSFLLFPLMSTSEPNFILFTGVYFFVFIEPFATYFVLFSFVRINNVLFSVLNSVR